jgi:hypothetical protein
MKSFDKMGFKIPIQVSYRRRLHSCSDSNYCAVSGAGLGIINPGLKPRATPIAIGAAHSGLVTSNFQIFALAAYLTLRSLRETNFHFPIKKSIRDISKFRNNDT